MIPVRQQGSDQDIRHPGQPGRLGQYLVMVEDPVEQDGLAKQEQEGQQGKQDENMMKNGIEAIQDQSVQVIVFGM